MLNIDFQDILMKNDMKILFLATIIIVVLLFWYIQDKVWKAGNLGIFQGTLLGSFYFKNQYGILPYNSPPR
jgi:hypothetical protein